MSRRGRCKCGAILKFTRGPRGYKMRCPACGSIVRLRLPAPRKRRVRRTPRQPACASLPAVSVPTPVPAQLATQPPPLPLVGPEIKLQPLPPSQTATRSLGLMLLYVGTGSAVVLALGVALLWWASH